MRRTLEPGAAPLRIPATSWLSRPASLCPTSHSPDLALGSHAQHLSPLMRSPPSWWGAGVMMALTSRTENARHPGTPPQTAHGSCGPPNSRSIRGKRWGSAPSSQGPTCAPHTSSQVWLGGFLRLGIPRSWGEEASVKRQLVERVWGTGHRHNIVTTTSLRGECTPLRQTGPWRVSPGKSEGRALAEALPPFLHISTVS